MKTLLAMFSLVVLLGCGAQAQQPQPKPTPAADAISGGYIGIDNQRHGLEGMTGVVDFSADWCGSCNAEAKAWKQYLGANAPKAKVITLMVEQNIQRAAAFKAKYAATWEFGSDADNLFEKFCPERLLPCNVIVVDGKIEWTSYGETHPQDIEAYTGSWK